MSSRSPKPLVRSLGLDHRRCPGAGPAGSGSPRSRACASCRPRPPSPRTARGAALLLVCRALALERTHSSSSLRRFLRLASFWPSTFRRAGLGLQVGGVVALVRVGTAAVELEDPLGDVVEEVPVVGDGDDGAGVLLQVLLQPLHALGVEVVGGLVEQQQVGLLQQQLAQRDAAALATGEHGDVGVRAAGSAARPSPARAGSRGPRRCGGRAPPAACPSRRAARRSRRPARPCSAEISLNRSSIALVSATPSSTFSEHGLGLVELRLLQEDADGVARA